MADPLLASMLTDAALRPSSRDAITRTYATLDDLLSATLDEIADAGGQPEATRLWEVIERRWRSDAIQAPATGGLAQIVMTPHADERPTSLRVQLRALALLEVTMRAAGFDPDASTAE